MELPTPKRPKDTSDRFVETNGAYLSLRYIRECALGLLGEPQTVGTSISRQETRYHTYIPRVEFNIGKDASQEDKWRKQTTCNSDTSAKSLINYFLHLRDACGIRSGKKKYGWDDREMAFVEIL